MIISLYIWICFIFTDMFIYVYIYIYIQMFWQEVPGSRALPKLPGFFFAHFQPTGPPSWTCTAKLGSKLDLCCQVGLQIGLVLPIWAPTWTCTADLGSNLASKRLSRGLQTFNFARQYGTLATFLQIGLYALQVLLDYLLAAVDTFLGAFWAQLGVS